MNKSKLFSILASFDDALWKECKSRLKEKFRPESNEWLLFIEIYKKRKDLSHPRLEKSSLILRLCGEGKESAFKSLVNRLLKAIEEVIVVHQVINSEDDWQKKWHLLKFYKSKGLIKTFNTEARQLLKSLRNNNNYNLDKDLKRFQLEKELIYSNISQKNKLAIFPSAKQALNSFYAHSSLFLEIEELNLKSLFKEVIDHQTDDSDHLECFLKCVKHMNDHKDDEAFQMVKETLVTNYSKFDSVLAHTSLIYLLNCCFYKIRDGDDKKLTELFQLYDFGLSSGVLLSNGKLLESTYLNIIESKCKLQPELDHSGFIKTWLPKTDTLFPETVRLLSMAFIHFVKDEHKEVLQLIQKHDYRRAEIHLGFRFKWMELCSTYSAGFIDLLLDSLIETNRRYFYRKRKKAGEQLFQSSMNLLKIIEMMSTNSSLIDLNNYCLDNALVMRLWVESEINKKAGNNVPA